MAEERYWYAVYTKPRWEKKVDSLLRERGYQSYCPLQKVRRKWSDRYKVVSEPLFSSYVFVHLDAAELSQVRQVSGIINFVYWNGRPGVIKDDEIIAIRKFLNEYEDISVVKSELKPKSKVMISQGAMMGKEGVVERVLHNIVELEIESLGYKLIAKVEKSNLFPVNERSK